MSSEPNFCHDDAHTDKVKTIPAIAVTAGKKFLVDIIIETVLPRRMTVFIISATASNQKSFYVEVTKSL